MKFVIKKGKNFWPAKEMEKISLAGEIYEKAKNPIKFWDELSRKGISWYKLYKEIYEQKGVHFSWFKGGKLNVCYNALDRHIEAGQGDNAAIIFIPENVNEKKKLINYSQLYDMVNSAANLLIKKGVKKGDVVTIYLPLIPALVVFMLACARIGAIHSVVFSAFSADALGTRIRDGKAKLIVTADYYYRKGKKINLKEKAEEACKGLKIKKIVVKRNEAGKFFRNNKVEVKPAEMDAEDILFILYTSGTTGKPKGVIHVNGGYAVQAYWSSKFVFNLQPEEIIWCTADIGWVTGHTYACYGPLLNGATSLLFEGMLDYPKADRYLKIIKENKVSVFYTAPTALRLFAQYGKKYTSNFNLNSLKILGSVGEPIDEHTWKWFFDNVGRKNCPVIDTYWQTETGSSVINALPGVGPFIPCFAGKSFPGINHEVVNEKGKKLGTGKKGLLVQKPPFAPALLRGIWRNEKRYKKYFKYGLYFSEDFALKEGENFRILGRVDDVIKVAGHRLSTAEIENAIESLNEVGEVAVVGKPDKIKGEVPVAFVKATGLNEAEIFEIVIKKIGPIAKPAEVYFIPDLPKTRSGKIMRRILKALVSRTEVGNTSTLVNPECVDEIRKVIGG